MKICCISCRCKTFVCSVQTLYFNGSLPNLHNISQYSFSTSLRRLHLSVLCCVSSLLLCWSLFGFPMTSAPSVILEEGQKAEKKKVLKTAYHTSKRKLFLLPLSYTFFISNPLPLLESFSFCLAVSLFLFFCFHSSSAPGTRKDFA